MNYYTKLNSNIISTSSLTSFSVATPFQLLHTPKIRNAIEIANIVQNPQIYISTVATNANVHKLIKEQLATFMQ